MEASRIENQGSFSPKNVGRKEELHKCNQCNYVSSHAQHLKVHLRRHSRESNQYDNSSSEVSSQKMRKIRSTEKKTYKCNPCNYWCTGAERMRTHMRGHNREKLFNCTLCDYASPHPRDLREHLIDTHRSLFDLSPSVETSSSSRKHVKSPSGEKANHCSRCDYSSSCGSNLKVHKFFYHFCYFVSGRTWIGRGVQSMYITNHKYQLNKWYVCVCFPFPSAK